MEKRDQGHLYPKLEVSRLTCLKPGIETGPLCGRKALYVRILIKIMQKVPDPLRYLDF
jgi:hypothetical protein